MDQELEIGTTRRHSFFCVDRERHTRDANVIEVVPKEIRVYDRVINGWLVTTEEAVIDNIIPLSESMKAEPNRHDPE